MTWYLFVNKHTIIWRAHFAGAHGYHPIKIHADDFRREIRRMAALDFDVVNNSDPSAIHTVSYVLKPLELVINNSGTKDSPSKKPEAYGCAIVSAEIVASLIADPPSESPSTADEVHKLFLLEVAILKTALSQRDTIILTRLALESVQKTKADFDKYLSHGKHEKSEEWNSENLDEWYAALDVLEKKLSAKSVMKRVVKKPSAFQRFKENSGIKVYYFLLALKTMGRYLISPRALWRRIWIGERYY